MNSELLLGQSEHHLEILFGNHSLHREVIAPYKELVASAKDEGIEIYMISGFRSFERQLTIFNDKAVGKRKIFDDRGEALNYAELSPLELLHAILRFSALPGLSRHHFGTDFDIVDRAAYPRPDYHVELSPIESDLYFSKLHHFLDDHFKNQNSLFFRPYESDLGGVAPEKWHISYKPLAEFYKNEHSIELIQGAIRNSPILLKNEILDNIEEIFERYFLRTNGN